MIITDIVEVNQSKSKVYIDNEFAFVLYRGEIRKHHIQKGAELTQQVYDVLTEEILPKRAKLRAMNLLIKRPYTEMKLRQKLQDGLYTEKYIDIAIAYVKSFGYVNDAAYARDYIESCAKSRSRKQIEIKLMQQGIAKDVIQDACDALLGDSRQMLEIEQIRKLFQKKYKGVMPAEAKEKMKLMQFFMRKGYSQNMVRQALREDFSLDD